MVRKSVAAKVPVEPTFQTFDELAKGLEKDGFTCAIFWTKDRAYGGLKFYQTMEEVEKYIRDSQSLGYAKEAKHEIHVWRETRKLERVVSVRDDVRSCCSGKRDDDCAICPHGAAFGEGDD